MAMKHHINGPSAWDRRLLCPGSFNAEMSMPPAERGRSSSYALEGRAAHQLVELCLEEDIDPLEKLGHSLWEEGEEFEVDMEMVESVDSYLQYFRGHQYGENVLSCTQLFEREVTLPLKEQLGEDIFGTADGISYVEYCDYAGLFEHAVLYIDDFKYGRGVPVDVKTSAQLRAYAFGALNHFDQMADLEICRDVHEIVLTVHQPRVYQEPQVLELTRADLLVWMEHEAIPTLLKATKDADAPRIPGKKQCQFCSYKAQCPELAAATAGMVAKEFDNLDAEVLGKAGSDPVLTEQYTAGLSPEDISVRLANVDLIRDWCRALESYALHLLEQGVELPEVEGVSPGYKLVSGRSSREWDSGKDPAQVERKLRTFGLKANAIWTRKLISVAQAEKRIGGAAFRDKVAGAFVMKREGKPTIAPLSDKRPALPVEGFTCLD